MEDLGPVAWPPSPITTARLVLRAPEARDRPLFVELLSSPEVHRFLGGPRDRADLERDLPEVPGRRPGHFVVEEGGAMVGQVSFKRGAIDRPVVAGGVDLGYLFLPDAWGRGLATEGATAALAWFAEQAPGEPVWLVTQTANAASLRLAARLGFREVERFTAWDAEQWLGVRLPPSE